MNILNAKTPINITVELTASCHLKCIFCPLPLEKTLSSLNPGHMSEDIWKKVIQGVQPGGYIMLIGYGETFLHPKILDWLKQLELLDIKFSASTNGVLFDKAFSKRVSEFNNLIHLNISLDTLNKDIYFKFRKIDIKHVLNGIENISNEFKNKEILTVSIILMKSNIFHIYKIPKYLARLGLRKIVLQSLKDFIVDVKHESLQHVDESAKYIDKFKKEANKYNIDFENYDTEKIYYEIFNKKQFDNKFYFSSVLDKRVTRKCMVPWEIPFIDKDGHVFPCSNSVEHKEHIMGSLSDSSFESIWNNENFINYRRKLISGNKLHDICKICTLPPIGIHPYAVSAEILINKSTFNKDRINLIVKNKGIIPWKKDDNIRVGTIMERDHKSVLKTGQWISDNRVCTFKEKKVMPNKNATFEFTISKNNFIDRENFQLVFDDQFWIPKTKFSILPNDKKITHLGFHPNIVSAEVLINKSTFNNNRINLVVRNKGTISWEKDDNIRIGTIKGRRYKSILKTEQWINDNRVCTFKEKEVMPGEDATFEFTLPNYNLIDRENFQLVSESQFWIPKTKFSIFPNDKKITHLGFHPDTVSAEIVINKSVFNNNRINLVVRNNGIISWEKGDNIRIGTIKERDHKSVLKTDQWISENRVCTFKEEEVMPGEDATFVFTLSDCDLVERENFQLVSEAQFWIPKTKFSIFPIEKKIAAIDQE